MKNLLTAFFLLTLVACAATAQQKAPRVSTVALDTVLASIVDSQHIPSAVVEVAAGKQLVYARAFGLRDVEHGIAANLDTRYEVGSITKQFTAAAIMLLQVQRRLSIDDKVSRYLPGAPHAHALTIRELLTMRSGLAAYNETPGFGKLLNKPGGYERILALVTGKPLHFAPGSDFEYSNTNYILLGRIVEVITRQPFDEFVREHELMPAGMTETSTVASERDIEDVAMGYGSEVPSWTPHIGEWFSSAGDIVSTAGDLLKWEDALTAGRIVEAKSFAAMTRVSPGNREGDSRRYYGFGLEMRRIDGEPAIEHGGSSLAFQTYMAFFPRENLRIVVLTNDHRAAPEAMSRKVFETIYPEVTSAYRRAQAAEYLAVPSPRLDLTMRFKEMLANLMRGNIDRSQLTQSLSTQFSTAVLRSLAEQAESLGPLLSFTYRSAREIKDGNSYRYTARYSRATMVATFTLNAQGKLSGIDISPQE